MAKRVLVFPSKYTGFPPSKAAIFLDTRKLYGPSRWIKRIKYSTTAQFAVGTNYCPCNALANYILELMPH